MLPQNSSQLYAVGAGSARLVATGVVATSFHYRHIISTDLVTETNFLVVLDSPNLYAGTSSTVNLKDRLVPLALRRAQ